MIPGIVAGAMGGDVSPPVTDPYWANVISLLNFEGADGSTTFTDAKGKTWAATGDAQIDTSAGYQAGLFDGNDKIYTADDADWNFGTGLWTLEFWLNPASATGFQNFLRKSSGSDFAPFTMALHNGYLRTRIAHDTTFGWEVDQTSSIGLVPSTLTHVVATRDSSDVFRQYVGGVESGTEAITRPALVNTSPVYIGAQSDDNSGYPGLIRAFRATKGVCRYPGGTTFAPPAAPFPTS